MEGRGKMRQCILRESKRKKIREITERKLVVIVNEVEGMWEGGRGRVKGGGKFGGC